MQILGKRIHEKYMKAQDAFGDMNDSVLEAVAGVRVIRAYVQERASEKQFDDMTEDVYAKNMEVEKIDALFNPNYENINRDQLHDWPWIWCLS